jgi:CBS domain-containing protein/mannitol/fructose-specific phosphotransferase system IIA component (Ntr-type)
VRLTEILRPEHVVAPLQAETAHEAVLQLARVLVDTGAVAYPDKLEKLFADGRLRDLIRVGDRVLLPHFRTSAVERLVVALGVTPRPLQVTPGEPEEAAQVVVLVLAPPDAAGMYLQTVAALARMLRHDHAVRHLADARSPAEVLATPEILDVCIQPRLTVRDVMSQRVYRVSPDAPVREALDLISQHRLRALPVVSEDREVLGMVSDRDLLRYLLPGVLRTGEGAGTAPGLEGEVRVREIMSRSVICISEDQALAEVASLMVSKDLERLPVTYEGKLTGFLTRGDIIRKMFGL